MDYEKKYKEAQERAKRWAEGTLSPVRTTPKGVCETIFPELTESEDERLRKLLVWQVHRNIEDETNDLAGSVYDGIKGHDPDLEESIEDWKRCLAYLEKQKEQKPADERDYSGLNDLERAIHRGFLCAGVDNVPVAIIKETAQECLAQMKPSWSEEDENCRIDILYYLEDAKRYYPQARKLDKCIKWFKSFRPSWKPSEEQMEALLWCTAHLGGADHRVLAELYEQLKAIKEGEE